MATLVSPASFLSPSLPSPSHDRKDFLLPLPPYGLSLPRQTKFPYSLSATSRTLLFPVRCASSSGESAPSHHENSRSKKSVLANLIQEIEPLDVSLIQKDVAATTVDAMKRTISGMLGLLPSDQFQVFIEALWEPLSKLLISSMMTGYTLRNAEYRLCLERNLDIHDTYFDNKEKPQDFRLKSEGTLHVSGTVSDATSALPDFGEMTPETQRYIINLQSRLSSVKRELHEVKRKNGALQMQQFVGEEKNELLDYLRSLQPEKVVELSEPTSPELKEIIHSVVYGLLATLSPKMHTKAPEPTENTPFGTVDGSYGADCSDLVENTSLHFQLQISLTRDYLARLLFWCMLLGHYLRGLEYRLELTELFSLPCVVESVASDGELRV